MKKSISKKNPAGNVRRTFTLTKKNARNLDVLAKVTGLEAEDLLNRFALSLDPKQDARDLVVDCIEYATPREQSDAMMRLKTFEGEAQFNAYNASRELDDAIHATPPDVATFKRIGSQYPKLLRHRAIDMKDGTHLVMKGTEFQRVRLVTV